MGMPGRQCEHFLYECQCQPEPELRADGDDDNVVVVDDDDVDDDEVDMDVGLGQVSGMDSLMTGWLAVCLPACLPGYVCLSLAAAMCVFLLPQSVLASAATMLWQASRLNSPKEPRTQRAFATLIIIIIICKE